MSLVIRQWLSGEAKLALQFWGLGGFSGEDHGQLAVYCASLG